MKTKEVLVLLTDHWADWEAGYAMAMVNLSSEYTVKTIAVDGQPKISIGGMRAEIDYAIDDYQNFDSLAMIIMTGSFSWAENDYPEINALIKAVRGKDIPIAAICGATIYLARHGFLDNIKHTGDTFDYFEDLQGYGGKESYVFAQIVNQDGFITANETAAVEFAREIMMTLKIDTDENIKEWYDNFKNGMAR